MITVGSVLLNKFRCRNESFIVLLCPDYDYFNESVWFILKVFSVKYWSWFSNRLLWRLREVPTINSESANHQITKSSWITLDLKNVNWKEMKKLLKIDFMSHKLSKIPKLTLFHKLSVWSVLGSKIEIHRFELFPWRGFSHFYAFLSSIYAVFNHQEEVWADIYFFRQPKNS